MMLHVVKKDGSLPWHIVDETGKMLRRAETKKRASLWCALLNGDISIAPTWYRSEFEHWLKISKKNGYREPDLTAAMYATQDARMLRLAPSQVNCDPKTGLPL